MAALILAAIAAPSVGYRAQAKEDTVSKNINEAVLEDNFADNAVIVTLKKDVSKQFNGYKPEDFAAAGCIAVEDLTGASAAIVEKGILSRNNNGDSLIDADNFSRILKLTIGDGTKEKVLNAIKILQSTRKDILAAEPNYILSLTGASADDPYYVSGSQWGLNGAKGIEAPSAWEITTGAKNVKVGVLDSGIDAAHPDLKDRIDRSLSKNFVDDNKDGIVDGKDTGAVSDPNGHGTHVAGIIAATGNNNTGVAGVCHSLTLVSLRVSDKDKNVKISDAVLAIDYWIFVEIDSFEYLVPFRNRYMVLSEFYFFDYDIEALMELRESTCSYHIFGFYSQYKDWYQLSSYLNAWYFQEQDPDPYFYKEWMFDAVDAEITGYRPTKDRLEDLFMLSDDSLVSSEDWIAFLKANWLTIGLPVEDYNGEVTGWPSFWADYHCCLLETEIIRY